MTVDSAPPRQRGRIRFGGLVRLRLFGDRFATTLPGHSWRRAQELNLVNQSLALAAQQMLCTAPLLVAFSAISLRTTGRGVGAALASYLGLSRRASLDVTSLFTSTTAISNTDTVVGLVLALLFATGVAATQARGYELIWSQPRIGLRSLPRQLSWVAGLCLYLVVVLYAGRAGHRVGHRVHAGGPAGPLVQLVVSLLFFWWSQHLLLSARVTWRRLLPGALCMASGMTVLVILSGPIMSGQIVSQVNDYGLVGATFVLSVWLVVLSGVVFGGALLGAVIAERRDQRTADILATLPPPPAQGEGEGEPEGMIAAAADHG